MSLSLSLSLSLSHCHRVPKWKNPGKPLRNPRRKGRNRLKKAKMQNNNNNTSNQENDKRWSLVPAYQRCGSCTDNRDNVAAVIANPHLSDSYVKDMQWLEQFKQYRTGPLLLLTGCNCHSSRPGLSCDLRNTPTRVGMYQNRWNFDVCQTVRSANTHSRRRNLKRKQGPKHNDMRMRSPTVHKSIEYGWS